MPPLRFDGAINRFYGAPVKDPRTKTRGFLVITPGLGARDSLPTTLPYRGGSGGVERKGPGASVVPRVACVKTQSRRE